MSAMAYSSPSIVMSSQMRDGSRVIQDDFREAYYWLRQNTHKRATVASWWDYGYQITSLTNRTVIVDNNTWNNTHIATVGLMLASNEKDAYDIINRLDIDYVLVLSGGVARYASDDIAKFLWPVRIANGVYPDKVKESDMVSQYGYTIDEMATDKFKASVMYKLCYYRMAELTNGQDYARNQRIGVPQFTLQYFEEAFTSENWIVRIYKVKDIANRSPTISGVSGKFSGFKNKS
jgi:dolichyl-diphosphooligosaccharide--protein glycosyltransferase